MEGEEINWRAVCYKHSWATLEEEFRTVIPLNISKHFIPIKAHGSTR